VRLSPRHTYCPGSHAGISRRGVPSGLHQPGATSLVTAVADKKGVGGGRGEK